MSRYLLARGTFVNYFFISSFSFCLLNYLQGIEVPNCRPPNQTRTCRFEALLSLNPQALLAVLELRVEYLKCMAPLVKWVCEIKCGNDAGSSIQTSH